MVKSMDEIPNRLMTPAEVAARFRVDPKTVTRWANQGLLPCIRTPGGHRRYLRSGVEHLLVLVPQPMAAPERTG